VFAVLYGFWVASYIAFNGDTLRDLATQFLSLAEKQGSTGPLIVGHRLMGTSLCCTGDPEKGRAHLDRALALYDPAKHRLLATRFGQDLRVVILSYQSLTSWSLGYPDAAVVYSDQALKEAREIGHAVTMIYALWHASMTQTVCRDYAKASALLDEAIALADEKGASFWKPLATVGRGSVLALTGDASKAIQVITSATTAYRSTGARVVLPLYLSSLAWAQAELGQFDDAWRCINEATTAIQTTKETWHEAEVNRMAGEIAFKPLERDAAKAEAYFERALAVARQQQARSWELRAATSMARLWRDQGRREEACELLAPVYGWFTEGFDTLDLKEAKALLDELAA
jgi:predicted ATPase